MGFITTIANWRSGQPADRELAYLDTGELAALARDIGLSTAQMTRLTARGGGTGEELSRFMRAIGLAPEKLKRTHAGVMRDMSVVCSGCEMASRCRRDLDRECAPIVQRYCPNAHTISALLAESSRAIV